MNKNILTILHLNFNHKTMGINNMKTHFDFSSVFHTEM